MIKIALTITFTMFMAIAYGQTFECDNKSYIISYTESEGKTILYEIIEENFKFIQRPISLSENRRLSGLSYNVLDKYLYAIDVDNYEIVRIDRNGLLSIKGIPSNIDSALKYQAGTISPEGGGYFLIGYDPAFQRDTRFYTINLSGQNLNAGYLGVTGANDVAIQDFATDPYSGIMYGYDNIQGRLIQVGLGGQMASLNFPLTGVKNVDGVWFNKGGELFAFSAQSGIYHIDKLHGNMRFVQRGPGGTHGDACSCPYTYSFTKDIQPREIVPCEEFEVIYSFQNRLGIGQTWITFRDTFPEGFEILSVNSSILTSSNLEPAPPNILALKNFIYLLRDNEIRVRIRAPSDYIGSFKSRVTQWDFPIAFGEYLYSDDPMTDAIMDETVAEIIEPVLLDFQSNLSFDCTGDYAFLIAPFAAIEYLWSSGATTMADTVAVEGWYSLSAVNDCVTYFDSIYVSGFPEPMDATIIGKNKIQLGEEIELIASLNRGEATSYKWSANGENLDCDCEKIKVRPPQTTTYELTVVTSDGCTLQSEWQVAVDDLRYLYSPTAFSPNGDGLHDRFYFQSSVEGVVKNIFIYNRWGNLVYTNQDIPLSDEQLGWDGKVNNQPLPPAVYIWMAEIEYYDGLKETRSGSISIF